MRPIACLLAALLAPAAAAAHGGEPSVTALRFPATRPGEVWGITDNQGLYAAIGPRTAWLCEDAVAPAAGILEIAALGDGRRWLVLTEEGLFASDDAGCSYHAAPADLAGQEIAALSVHPARPAEAVAAARTFGAANDLWRTADGGGTWRPAGLALRGRFVQLLRSEADAERLYAVHDRGGFTSGDGGRSWGPMPLGPPALDPLPAEVTLLAAPPGAPGRLFAGVELPTGLALVRSDDAGATWREVLRVDDFEAALAFDAAGREGLLITAFDDARRTLDGGATWRREPLPVDRLRLIARDPATGRLWGSTGLFFGGPFALGVSDDFGRTWAPALARFEDVDARWDCPPDAPARTCCGTLCPGQPPDAMCPGQVPDDGDACALRIGPPLGPLPGFEADAGAPDAAVRDAGPPDAEVPDGEAPPEWGMPEWGLADAERRDATPRDAAIAHDRGPLDRGAPDARVRDAELRDAELRDAELRDAELRDAELRDADLRDAATIAPDITVVPAHPPTDGCRHGGPAPAPLWPLALVGLLGCARSKRARASGRTRRRAASAR